MEAGADREIDVHRQPDDRDQQCGERERHVAGDQRRVTSEATTIAPATMTHVALSRPSERSKNQTLVTTRNCDHSMARSASETGR